MKPKVKGKPLGDIVPNIEKALDQAFAEHILLSQSKLSSANPKDTGRMASSWFVGQNAPNRSVRAKNWGKPAKRGKDGTIIEPGSKTVQVEQPNPGSIKYDGTWYISNNLPYAERVAYDPVWAKGGGGGPAWFTSIVAQMPADLRQRMAKHLPK